MCKNQHVYYGRTDILVKIVVFLTVSGIKVWNQNEKHAQINKSKLPKIVMLKMDILTGIGIGYRVAKYKKNMF